MSLPSLGAWIEIMQGMIDNDYDVSRSLHWERGLKLLMVNGAVAQPGRSLHWERGLKFCQPEKSAGAGWSLPSLGAWIEIEIARNNEVNFFTSLPSLGAWIEIASTVSSFGFPSVAPFIGSVD